MQSTQHMKCTRQRRPIVLQDHAEHGVFVGVFFGQRDVKFGDLYDDLLCACVST